MKTILIIDDDKMCARILARILESLGFATAALSDGRGAFQAVSAVNPVAVLLDVVMPHKEGIETTMELKGRRPELPIIAMSSNEFYLKMMLDIGADASLSKPIKPKKLGKVLVALGLLRAYDESKIVPVWSPLPSTTSDTVQ